MIVLSFLLVLVAAVTLIIGLFQDTLVWIWTSIGSCVVAMIFLGIGVLQRRSGQPATEGADSGYGPGAISGLLQDDSEQEADTAEDEDVSVVPKRTADAEEDEEAAAAPGAWGSASSGQAGEEPPAAPSEQETAAVSEPASTREVLAEQQEAAEIEEEAVKAAPAASETTGAAARRELDQVKGLGRAKQEALLAHFGSLEAIRAADVSELQNVKGFGAATAQQVHAQLVGGDGEAAVAPREAPAEEPAAEEAETQEVQAASAPETTTTGAAARKQLAEIKGLGPAKQKALLDRFGSLEAIRDADVSSLQEVKGIGGATAQEIQKQLS